MREYTPRQIEILTLLSKYGVLGSKMIQSLLKQNVGMNRLRESLQGMEGRDLICRFNFNPGGTPMSYWMLPDEDSAKGRAIRASGLKEIFFRHKRGRYSHIPHENFCTLVHASLERQMPTLQIIREATKNFGALPKHLISARAEDDGYTPDLCVGVPGKNLVQAQPKSGLRWIAVEVDRSNRSKKRMAQRMNIYTKHTAFSGLLYLVPNVATAKSLREIYVTRGGKNTFRLRGAATSFLAVGTVPNNIFDVNEMSIWCGDHEIPLSAWLSLFALNEAQERDDALSGLSGHTTGIKELKTKTLTK